MTREKIISIRLSDEEYTAIKENADRQDLSVSDFLRYAGLQEEGGTFSCGSEILEHIQGIHEDADKLYLYVQEYYNQHHEDLSDIICSRWIESKILEQNRKLRYITMVLENLDGTLIPPYKDLSFTELKEQTKMN